MNGIVRVSRDALRIDAAAEAERIRTRIRNTVLHDLRRKGVVVGVSGGVDSAVVVTLCAFALGRDRVLALFTPEVDSSPESIELGKYLAEKLGISWHTENITAALEGVGCYRRRDDAVRTLVPEFGPGWKFKIVLPHASEAPSYSLFSFLGEAPDGRTVKKRLTLEAYRGIVAATNFKQRVRKAMEYYHADRLHYAVAGTPNFLEHNLGFFVKNGDGAADFKPIAHLYKSQVYQLAQHLDIPDRIRKRQPTTDTYSLQQTQEEFYFSLPLVDLDLCLYAHDLGLSPAVLSTELLMPEHQAQSIYAAIESKRKAAHYLQAEASTLDPLPRS